MLTNKYGQPLVGKTAGYYMPTGQLDAQQ